MPQPAHLGVRRITLVTGVLGIFAVAIVIGAAVVQSGQCGALLGLRPARTADLACSLVSNGVELASYRCAVPTEPDLAYEKVSARLTGPEGLLLGRWDAPISYGLEGRARPMDSWGPLDTSAALVDDGDGHFGPGDVFHLDAVQGYRIGGARFQLTAPCWTGSATLA